MSFYLIEKKEQLEKIKELGDCYIEFIPFNSNFHPKLNKISLIYLRPLNKHKGFIFCINHSESLSLELNDVFIFLLSETKKLFCQNKKVTLYYYKNSDKVYDVSFIEIPDLEKINNNCINYFYNKYPNNPLINRIIPISKHYEFEEEKFKTLKPIIKRYNEDDFKYQFNNGALIQAFWNIEQQGIKIDKNKYLEYFNNIQYPEYNISKGKIYTSYNLYNKTGRPSNHFNGINFSALQKDNGERNLLIPEHDLFIEIDVSAYHPRLAAKQIGFEFPQNIDVYDYLNMSKQEVFTNIYGYITEENKTKPFFKELNEWMIETKINNKQLSHLLQMVETNNNVKIIQKIHEYLSDKHTKLVHYLYDSFLLDYSKEDGDIEQEINKIIEYPTKTKRGTAYGNLKIELYGTKTNIYT